MPHRHQPAWRAQSWWEALHHLWVICMQFYELEEDALNDSCFSYSIIEIKLLPHLKCLYQIPHIAFNVISIISTLCITVFCYTFSIYSCIKWQYNSQLLNQMYRILYVFLRGASGEDHSNGSEVLQCGGWRTEGELLSGIWSICSQVSLLAYVT